MLLLLLLAAVIVGGDQAIKYWAMHVLKPVGDIPIWQNVLHLTYAENTGAAFSMFTGAKWFFVAVSLVATAVTIFLVFKYRKDIGITAIIGLGMVMGGNLGNLIDRLRFSYVIDYVYVKIIRFAIFNLADACITVGAILLGIYILFIHGRGKKQNDEHRADPKLPG